MRGKGAAGGCTAAGAGLRVAEGRGPDLGVYVTGADSRPAGSLKPRRRIGTSESLEIKVKKSTLLLSNYSVWVARRVQVGAVGGKRKFLLADAGSLEKQFGFFPSSACFS